MSELGGVVNVSPYTSMDFFEQLNADIAATQAGDRVSLTTLCLEPGEPIIKETLGQLSAAALRGAEVTLAIDAYSLMYPRGIGPFALPISRGADIIGRCEAAIADLSESGANIAVINQPKHRIAQQYKGRSHIKINAVNGKVYLGGPNLSDTERTDMVVGFEQHQTAARLHQLTADLVEAGNTADVLGGQDFTHPVDNITDILVDAGKPNQSLILDQALGLIDEAEEYVVLGSQYFPNGATSQRLRAAHKRGVDVYIAYNHPTKHDQLVPMHKAIIAAQRLRGNPPEFFANQVPVELPKLHAKVLASEKAAMVGSHNYIPLGVRYGTAEMTLIQRDPVFAKSVRELLLKQVQLPEPAAEFVY